MAQSEQTKLSHFDEAGQAGMVDVSAKQPTRRTATASAFVELSTAVLAAMPSNPKGDPLEVARFPGVLAAKRTADLIPMCGWLPGLRRSGPPQADLLWDWRASPRGLRWKAR